MGTKGGILLLGLLLSGPTLAADWLVQPGDSLYAIGQKLLPGDVVGQRVLRERLLAANPSAFIDGDPGRLMVGKSLHVPALPGSPAAPVRPVTPKTGLEQVAISTRTLATGYLYGADMPTGYSAMRYPVLYGSHTWLPVSQNGKRFFAQPQGDAAAILKTAAQVKKLGKAMRSRRSGLVLPGQSGNQSLLRYDYTSPSWCGGERFSYFEGDGVQALGYHYQGKLIVDVLSSATPYTAPRLWGPYDQVLNDKASMAMLFGNGREDGFGPLQASYAIGPITRLPESRRQFYGALYRNATLNAASCNAATGTILSDASGVM